VRRFAATGALLLLPLLLAQAQQPERALMSAPQVNELFTRSLQLMQATSVAIPEMTRAGAPIFENARQAADNLKQRASNLQFTYSFLTNLRAYVVLADSVTKPFPFPAEGTRQLAELRENLNRAESHFQALLAQRDALLRNPDRDNLKRYAEANQRLAPPREGSHRVVFLGDSITDNWRLEQYFPDRDFVNRGIGGQISGEMLGRFKADVIDLKPEVVVILAGTNDLARGVNVLAIENNYSMMADLADRHGIKVVFSSVLPVSDYHKDRNPAWEMTRVRPPVLILALNDWLKSFCEQRGYTYLDYFPALADGSGMLKADLADDGLHPNAAGYRAMSPLVLAAIQTALGPSSPQLKPKRGRLFHKGS
jgi:lysophospholipase L1-like esterase